MLSKVNERGHVAYYDHSGEFPVPGSVKIEWPNVLLR